MTVESVVKTAAELVGIDGPVTAYWEGGDAEGKRAVDALLGCLHLVEMELASEHFPLANEEEIQSDGTVYFEELSQRPLKIVAVKDGSGAQVEHRVFPLYLSMPKGKYTVEYHYLPMKKGEGEELEFDAAVTTALVAYGVAAQYSRIVGLYEEASVWEEKFRRAIAAAKPLAKGLAMRARNWN